MWKTPVTNNQAFVHIRSIGRYDSRGTTCHWEIDKKRATGDLYLPASRAIHRRWGGGSWTLPSPRWSHSSSTLFLLVTYHERNLQPLAEGEICNGTSFCLRQEPVTILASTFMWLTLFMWRTPCRRWSLTQTPQTTCPFSLNSQKYDRTIYRAMSNASRNLTGILPPKRAELVSNAVLPSMSTVELEEYMAPVV